MPKRLLVLLALCGLAFTTAPAQDVAVEKPADAKTEDATPKPAARKPDAKPAAKATPTPIATSIATPAPVKKKGFFQRIFGGRERTTPPPATPTPAATPAPLKPKRPLLATPAPAPATPAPATPAPDGGEPKATPAPKKSRTKTVAVADKRSLPPAPPANADSDVLEKYKYDVARIKVMEDPELQQLKVKSDTASTDEEAIMAQRTYSRALFDKMRNIEPSLKDRIDRTEAALMKRLENQPPAQQ